MKLNRLFYSKKLDTETEHSRAHRANGFHSNRSDGFHSHRCVQWPATGVSVCGGVGQPGGKAGVLDYLFCSTSG